jgi:hypothetical protein
VKDLDLSALFEPWDRYFTYTSLEEELGAIAVGSKAMSYFSFADADMATEALYLEVCNIASNLGLLTIRRSNVAPEWEGPIPHTYLFILRNEEEAWRIPAFLFALKVAFECGWSDVFEKVIGGLLGYSEEEVRRWLEDIARFHVKSAAATILFLMSSTQAATVRMLGGRCVDPKTLISPVTAFYNIHGKVVRRGASSLLPPDHELLRASVDHDFFHELFPANLIADPAVELAVRPIDKSRGTALNSALRSNFQFLGPDGWHSARVDS